MKENRALQVAVLGAVIITASACEGSRAAYSANEWDSLPYQARAAITFCTPDTVLIESPPETGLTGIQALPPTIETFNLISRYGLPRFPGAPLSSQAWLRENDNAVFETLGPRAAAVIEFDADKKNLSEEMMEIKDWCIFQIHRQGRQQTEQNIREVLAEYTVRYLHNPYISLMLSEHIPFYIPRVNKLLESSGVEERLPENLADYIIYKTSNLVVGGGDASPDPFFLVYGNYDSYTAQPGSEANQDVDNIFRRTIFHEGVELIRNRFEDEEHQPLTPLSSAEAAFSHTAIGFTTLPAQYWSIETFEPWEAVDPRVQEVFVTLSRQAELGDYEAYQRIVRASATYEGIGFIRDNYDENRTAEQKPFAELFATEDVTEYKKTSPYFIVGKYLSDFYILTDIATRLSEPGSSEN